MSKTYASNTSTTRYYYRSAVYNLRGLVVWEWGSRPTCSDHTEAPAKNIAPLLSMQLHAKLHYGTS